MAGQIERRVASPPASGSSGSVRYALIGLDHRLDRHVDLQVERLADPGVDDPRRPPRADHEPPDLLERVLRRAQPDALGVAVVVEGREALERQREVRAALRPRDGVDLVDDDRLDAAEHLARAGREHQVQRLGRRDQDVRRRPLHRGAVALRRVAGAHRDRDVGPDAAQRRAQVTVDVVAERLERRHVDEPRVVGRLAAQPVEAPEEGRERLAAAGRRRDEHVLAARDRRPGLRLGRRRALERAFEPVADRGREGGERRRRHLGRGYPARGAHVFGLPPF